MASREEFLEKIKENPKDRTARLVFADWLDEQDQPIWAERYRNWDETLCEIKYQVIHPEDVPLWQGLMRGTEEVTIHDCVVRSLPESNPHLVPLEQPRKISITQCVFEVPSDRSRAEYGSFEYNGTATTTTSLPSNVRWHAIDNSNYPGMYRLSFGSVTDYVRDGFIPQGTTLESFL